MEPIRLLAEKLWSGEVSTANHHPFTPLFALEEVAAGVAFVSSFANVTAVDTAEGLVLIDTGSALVGPAVRDVVRAWSKAPAHTAVYTHGHIDHVFGIKRFDAEADEAGRPRPRVIAHRDLPARFDRYRITGGYNGCINTRQFGASVAWPTEYRYPDATYEGTSVITVGGEAFELHHARGETDDHTWVWMPSKGVLFTGDLFIWASPNAGNPQKVQRYPREWAEALSAMAGLGAEVLVPGHGVPIYGRDRVKLALSETAELLSFLVSETLSRMNAGATLDAILHEVRAPARLLERPYLRPVYDDPEFVVRNVWRQYGGWYDGNPAHLKPAKEADLAAELCALSGGASVVAARAEALLAEGKLELAAHLAELAAQAAPEDAGVRATRRVVYRRRAEAETSLMAKGIFRAASDD